MPRPPLTPAQQLESKSRRSKRASSRYHAKKAGRATATLFATRAAINRDLREQAEAEARRRSEQTPTARLLPWFAYGTADERRQALLAKLDREQPLPASTTY